MTQLFEKHLVAVGKFNKIRIDDDDRWRKFTLMQIISEFSSFSENSGFGSPSRRHFLWTSHCVSCCENS